jgi:hypothetical protein
MAGTELASHRSSVNTTVFPAILWQVLSWQTTGQHNSISCNIMAGTELANHRSTQQYFLQYNGGY